LVSDPIIYLLDGMRWSLNRVWWFMGRHKKCFWKRGRWKSRGQQDLLLFLAPRAILGCTEDDTRRSG